MGRRSSVGRRDGGRSIERKEISRRRRKKPVRRERGERRGKGQKRK